ncbi:DUF3948 family protein [Bacillus sp. AY3-1]|nr:DUF3948 family protein [Bacillus sp. AY3-1]
MKEQVLQVTKGDFVGSAINRISIKRISIIEVL